MGMGAGILIGKYVQPVWPALVSVSVCKHKQRIFVDDSRIGLKCLWVSRASGEHHWGASTHAHFCGDGTVARSDPFAWPPPFCAAPSAAPTSSAGRTPASSSSPVSHPNHSMIPRACALLLPSLPIVANFVRFASPQGLSLDPNLEAEPGCDSPRVSRHPQQRPAVGLRPEGGRAYGKPHQLLLCAVELA